MPEQENRHSRELQTLTAQRRYLDAITAPPFNALPPMTPRSNADACVVDAVKTLFGLIRPRTARGVDKIRVGGPGDGGYVMLDPGEGGIAYSFGVSTVSPWDLDMARRNFRVFQYDGSVDAPPDEHPNIFFHKYYIGGNSAAMPSDWKTLHDVLRDHHHEDEHDIILQMDIEGGEWEFFNAATAGDLLRFKQIIVEFHKEIPDENTLAVLRAIRETHTPIHVHCNNVDAPTYIPPLRCFYSGVFEVSYARTADFRFEPCHSYFPTPLDSPNAPEKPEIPLGYFDLILGGHLPPLSEK